MELENDGLDWGSCGSCVYVFGVEVHRIQNSQTTIGEETQRGLSVTRILRILLITVILLFVEIAFARPNAFTGSTTRRCRPEMPANGPYAIFEERALALIAPVHRTNMAAEF